MHLGFPKRSRSPKSFAFFMKRQNFAVPIPGIARACAKNIAWHYVFSSRVYQGTESNTGEAAAPFLR
jgi:hypothetical protein